MTDITELAQSLKAAAEKASGGDWVKESGDGWDATCSNDDQANSGFIIAHFVGPDSEANREFVQLANPANVLALVEALENSESRLHDVAVACATAEQALEKAQQQTTESENRVRKQNRHICELFDDNTALRQRIAGLESCTVTVKQGEVLVTVAGFTGCGKSAIAGEIEIAMKAIGLPVTWANGDSEKRMTGADWLTAIEMYKPTVRIVEVNIHRAAGIKVEAE